MHERRSRGPGPAVVEHLSLLGPVTCRGMAANDPNPRQPHGWFFDVPGEVLDDRDTLPAWARQAMQAGTAAKT